MESQFSASAGAPECDFQVSFQSFFSMNGQVEADLLNPLLISLCGHDGIVAAAPEDLHCG